MSEFDISQELIEAASAAAASSRAALYQIDWGSGVDPDPATLEDHCDYEAAAAAEAADDRRRAFEDNPVVAMAVETIAAHAAVDAYYAAKIYRPSLVDILNEADGERHHAAEIANAALASYDAADAAFNAADAASSAAQKEWKVSYEAYKAAEARRRLVHADPLDSLETEMLADHNERQHAADIAIAAKAASTAANAAKATALKAVSVIRQEFLSAYAAYQVAEAAYDIAYHRERKEREGRERQSR